MKRAVSTHVSTWNREELMPPPLPVYCEDNFDVFVDNGGVLYVTPRVEETSRFRCRDRLPSGYVLGLGNMFALAYSLR